MCHVVLMLNVVYIQKEHNDVLDNYLFVNYCNRVMYVNEESDDYISFSV